MVRGVTVFISEFYGVLQTMPTQPVWLQQSLAGEEAADAPRAAGRPERLSHYPIGFFALAIEGQPSARGWAGGCCPTGWVGRVGGRVGGQRIGQAGPLLQRRRDRPAAGAGFAANSTPYCVLRDSAYWYPGTSTQVL